MLITLQINATALARWSTGSPPASALPKTSTAIAIQIQITDGWDIDWTWQTGLLM